MAFWDRKPRRIRATVEDDPGIATVRRQAASALKIARDQERQLKALEKFKAQYPNVPIQDLSETRAQATDGTGQQGQMWGWGWPRGYGAKFPGGLSSPYGGISINHWQLRQQARDSSFDAPHTRALITRFADSAVHTGLKLEPTPQADILGITPEEAEAWSAEVRQAYTAWCKSPKQNRSRQMSWHQAQHLLSVIAERDNDQFIRLYYSDDPALLNPLQFEVLDANMIRADAFTVTNIIGKFPDGILRNDDGSEKSYLLWVQKLSPDQNYSYNFDPVEVPRIGKDGMVYMLHGFKAEYAGQGRGFSSIGAILQELEIIEDIILAVGKRAVNQSNIAMYVKPSAKNPASNPWEAILQQAAGPSPLALGVPGTSGTAVSGVPVTTNPITYTPLKEATVAIPGSAGVYSLMEGEDLILPSAGAQDPQLLEFLKSWLGMVSASRGMPYEILVMAFNSSYTASLAASKTFEKICTIKIQDHDDNLETPMYEMFLTCEIAAGRIACPGWNDPRLRAAWLAHTLTGAPPFDPDPTKTADANMKNLQMGLTNLDVLARDHNGSNAAQNRARNKKDVEELVTWPWQVKVTAQTDAPQSQDEKPPVAAGKEKSPESEK